MRIGIVGNSHLAALRLALDEELVKFPDKEIVFWGLGGWRFSRILVRRGHLAARQKDFVVTDRVWGACHRSIDVGALDCLVFHGAELTFTQDLVVPFTMPYRRRAHFSQALLRAAVEEWLERQIVVRWSEQLRSVVPAPIVLSFQPAPSESALTDSPNKGFTGGADTREMLCEYVTAAAHRRGFDVVPQPEITFSQYCGHTRHEYCVGSTRLALDEGFRGPNVGHMNARYGAEVLKAVVARIEAIAAPREPLQTRD